MGWTNPKTWSVGELLTAANMNLHLRDNMNYVYNRHKIKAGDESVTSSTVLQDDNDLILNVLASEVYLLDMWLMVDAHASGGLKIGWTFPTGLTMRWSVFSGLNTNQRWTNDLSSSSSALQDQTQTQSYNGPAAGTIWGLSIVGIIQVGGTAGNLTLQWAQITSNATPTILKQNSLFIATRVNT